MFVCNLGLSVGEAVFHLGVSTWTVERYPRRHQYLHKTPPPLFIPQGSTQTIQRVNLGAWHRHTAVLDNRRRHRHSAARQSSPGIHWE